MIIFIEGQSKSGKTTLINKYLEKYPDTILFKGDGQVRMGLGEDWEKYNFYMHNIIERLDHMNHYSKTILWDRGLSEAVHGDHKWARLAKAHVSKALVYIDTNHDVLINRGSLAGGKVSIEKEAKAYYFLLSEFHSLQINPKQPDYYITDAIVEELHTFIQDAIEECTSKNLKK